MTSDFVLIRQSKAAPSNLALGGCDNQSIPWQLCSQNATSYEEGLSRGFLFIFLGGINHLVEET